MAKLGSQEDDNEPDIKLLTKWGGMIRMGSADDSNEDKHSR